MKKLILYSFIALGLMTSCRKSDNPKLPDLARVPMPKITKDLTGNEFITDANNFNAKFNVDLMYPSDVKPSKMDIVVMKNGSPTNVKLLKAGVSSWPTALTFTTANISALFGGVAVPGDSYTLGADIYTQDGTKYPAFPSTGGAAAYSTGVGQTPGASVSVEYDALCPFDITKYGAIGSTVLFTVVSDAWNDYGAGSAIPVKIVDATSFSFQYNVSDNAHDIVIKVDPATNRTSVAKVLYGNYGDGDDFSAVSVAGSTLNTVTPCTFGISVNLTQSDVSTTYGNFAIVLKKK